MSFRGRRQGRRDSSRGGRDSGGRGRGRDSGGRGRDFRGRSSGGRRGGSRGRGGTPRGDRRKPPSFDRNSSKRQPRGMKRGSKMIIEEHRFPGIFIARGKDDALLTINSLPGESVYGEKLLTNEENGEKIEYRVWNPYRSKLGAAILRGLKNIYISPGTRLLYIGAASGTTVSHCSDIVGSEGAVYGIEFSKRTGRDLLTVASKRTNIIPIIEDARKPARYRMLIGTVDTIFADVAQPDQARIVALNAHYFLKSGGHYVISIKANCIDSTEDPEVVFAGQAKELKKEGLMPREQVSLEPFEKNHAAIVGVYRPEKRKKNKSD